MNVEQDKQIKDLEKAVTDAIKEKKKKNDLSFLENINDENLRYIQKFIDVEISKRNTKISIPSLLVGAAGISLSFVAIGLAFFLVGISLNSVIKIVYPIGGIIIIFSGIWLFRDINKYKGEFEKVKKEIEFMQDILLEIERKLLFKRDTI